MVKSPVGLKHIYLDGTDFVSGRQHQKHVRFYLGFDIQSQLALLFNYWPCLQCEVSQDFLSAYLFDHLL